MLFRDWKTKQLNWKTKRTGLKKEMIVRIIGSKTGSNSRILPVKIKVRLWMLSFLLIVSCLWSLYSCFVICTETYVKYGTTRKSESISSKTGSKNVWIPVIEVYRIKIDWVISLREKNSAFFDYLFLFDAGIHQDVCFHRLEDQSDSDHGIVLCQ